MEKIEITKKEYLKLKRDSEILDALRQGGVDNWEGYGYAMGFLEDDEEEE